MFFNVSLAAYYFLIIVKQCREVRLKQLAWLLLGLPLLLGLGLAFATIPFVANGLSTCHVDAFLPFSEDLWAVLVFFVVPVALSTVVVAALLLYIYCRIRIEFNRSERCDGEISSPPDISSSSRTHQSQSLRWTQSWIETEVFWQCVFYAVAFLLTWPVLIPGIFMASNFDSPFWFFIYAVVVAPMQGLTNAICYFRPYYWKRYRRRRDGRSPKRFSSNPSQEEDHQELSDSHLHYVRDSGSYASQKWSSYFESIFEGIIDPAIELATFGNDSSGKTEIIAEEGNMQELSTSSSRNGVAIPDASSVMFHESNTLSGEFLAPVVECIVDDRSHGSESYATTGSDKEIEA